MQSGTGLGIDFTHSNAVARPLGDLATSNAVPLAMVNSYVERSLRHTADNHSARPSMVAMRSSKGMSGLLLAEVGASMVEIEEHASSQNSCFKEGKAIEPGSITPIRNRSEVLSTFSGGFPRSRTSHRRDGSLDSGLSRQGTLLSVQASPERRAEELKRLLGNSSAKVKSRAIICSGPTTDRKSPNAVAFEQGKSRVRVSLDLTLENNIAVENGYLSGCVQVRVNLPKGCDNINIGAGKIRIVGFEMLLSNEHRYIFYQVAMPLADASSEYGSLFVSGLDNQGFGLVKEGTYLVPFSVKLPVVTSGGKPRGVVSSRCGAVIKYISVVSMRVIDPVRGKRSIAHFYRECEIWPALDIGRILSPAPHPVEGQSIKKLFMGGDGPLSISASLHRATWIAGQPIHVRVQISNETKKSVRSLGLSILCKTTIFRSSSHVGDVSFKGDSDAYETETSERKIAETVLLAGQKGTKGHASAKGWWSGVGPGGSSTLCHSILVPIDALSIARARLLEVGYALRVNLNVGALAGTSDAINVVLPVRIVNAMSLDPPPYGPKIKASLHEDVTTPRMSVSAVQIEQPASQSQRSRPTVPSARRQTADLKRRPAPLDLSKPRVKAPPSGLPISSSVFTKANDALAPVYPIESNHPAPFTHAPVPGYPVNQVLQDLGGFESIEELDDVLGDIPGSASMLERSEIPSEFWPRGAPSSNISYKGQGDLDSDEEIEMMVGYASARIQDPEVFVRPETCSPELQQSALIAHSVVQGHKRGHSTVSEYHEGPKKRHALPERPQHHQKRSRQTGTNRQHINELRLAANQRRSIKSSSPKRPTFSERVQMKKLQLSQTASSLDTQDLRHDIIRTNVSDVLNLDGEHQSESPESIYTDTTTTPFSQFSEDGRSSQESNVASSTQMCNRDPSPFGEDLQTGSDFVPPTLSSPIRSAPMQRLRGLHDRQAIASVRHTQFLGTEADISPVRRRIALLEEKTRQEIRGPRPPFTSRYTTT